MNPDQTVSQKPADLNILGLYIEFSMEIVYYLKQEKITINERMHTFLYHMCKIT